MSSNGLIKVENLSKCYSVFDSPPDRLKQFIVPRVQSRLAPLMRLAGRETNERRYYREYWALQGVNFTVEPGETLGVIGRNGAGKSTLLQLVCGTLTPTTGTAEVTGRIAALLELGSGFNPEFTGRENVYLNASVLGLSTAEIDAKFDDILAFSDIGEFIDQPTKSYSSGMAMRLAFAVIAHVDADVLIVDEALAVGDAFFQQKCMRWLRKFRERGTVLFCGHDTVAVMNLCTKAIWLDNGQIEAQGDAKDVCEAYNAAILEQTAGLAPTRRKIGEERKTETKTFAPKTARAVSPAQAAALKQFVDVFEFDDSTASFGKGDAKVENVTLAKPDGSPLGLIEGGEEVRVTLTARGHAEVEDIIMGFHIKDRLGQAMIGDNTFAKYQETPLSISEDEVLQASFVFELPCLLSGDYSITASIASGTLETHVQQHWMHDALVFSVQSPFKTGVLFNTPMEMNVTSTDAD
ncbi:MAG: ABC transporter ATP-binding protein [Pseudomonadota bacterium]